MTTGTKLKFTYCECGCHCFTAVSKGMEYSIFNDLLKPKMTHHLYLGHGRYGERLGSFATSEYAKKWAQYDYDKTP